MKKVILKALAIPILVVVSACNMDDDLMDITNSTDLSIQGSVYDASSTYPSIYDIIQSSVVRSAMKNAWDETIEFSLKNFGRREIGLYIL